MKQYKLTKQGNVYHIYSRFLFFFWYYEDTYSNLENAKKYIAYKKEKEIEINE